MEALTVANANKTTQGVRIILGGTTIHNSKRYDIHQKERNSNKNVCTAFL